MVPSKLIIKHVYVSTSRACSNTVLTIGAKSVHNNEKENTRDVKLWRRRRGPDYALPKILIFQIWARTACFVERISILPCVSEHNWISDFTIYTVVHYACPHRRGH